MFDNKMKQMEEKYGRGKCRTLGKMKEEFANVQYIPSGSLYFDEKLGFGWPACCIAEIIGEEQAGKQQFVNSKVVTPYGYKKIGELKIDDEIYGEDGKIYNINGIYPQGIKSVYEVEFNDKSKTTSGLEHLWTFYTKKPLYTSDKTFTKPLKEIITEVSSGKKLYIPVTKAIPYNLNYLEIDPYYMGLLLGGGGFTTNSITFTNSENDLQKQLDAYIELMFDCCLSKKDDQIQATSVEKTKSNNHIIKTILKRYGLLGKHSHEKFIPEEYKISSIDQRIKLLAGLINTNGNIDDNGQLRISTTSKRMFEDIKEIGYSLGLGVGFYISNRKDKSTEYTICIKGTDIFNQYLSKKHLPKVKKAKGIHRRYITSIRYLFDKECVCISTSNPTKLYLTDDFIVTHNTTTTLHAIANAQSKFPKKYAAFVDVEHRFDPDYAVALGVDMDRLFVSQPECIFEDEFVLTKRGYKKFGTFNDAFSRNEEINTLELNTTNTFNKVIKPAYRIRTGKGELICSEDHRFKTFTQYKTLSNLNYGDYVASPINYNCFQQTSNQLNADDAILFGILIADGTYNKENVKFTKKNDVEIVNWVEGYLQKYFPGCRLSKSRNTIQYRISKINKSNKNPEFSKFIHKYLGYVVKKDKFIPEEIFESGDAVLAGLVGGLWSCGGLIEKKCLSFSTTSKNVCLNTQAILNHFGIIHNYSTYKKKNYNIVYKITIEAKEGIKKFKNTIPLIGKKKLALNMFDLTKKESYIKYPKEVWEIIFNEMKKTGKPIHHYSKLIHKRTAKKSRHLFNTKKGISLEYLQHIYEHLKTPIIKKLVEDNILYTKINSITPLGLDLPMCDISEPINKNFIANNFLVHNSAEEALDMTEDYARDKDCAIVVVDSVAGLVPKEELEKPISENSVSKLPLVLGRATRKLKDIAKKAETLIIFTNQWRIVQFQPFIKKGTPGGAALKYFASIRVELKRQSKLLSIKIKGIDQNIGQVVDVFVKKNSFAPPFRKTQFNIIFGKGISMADEIVDAGIQLDIIEKSGTWFTYEDLKRQGKLNFIEALINNKKAFNTIKAQVENHFFGHNSR